MVSYRFKRKMKRQGPLLLLILLPFVLGFALYAIYPSITGSFVKQLVVQPVLPATVTPNFSLLDEDPLSLEGFTAVAVEAVPGALILKDNCTSVFIYMSNLKSFSIKRGLENTLDIRPNYHDLTYDLLNHYDVQVLMAKISRLKNNFYYADLFFEQEGNLLHLDSRPSDAVGIASRFQAPIYVSDSILENQGVRVC